MGLIEDITGGVYKEMIVFVGSIWIAFFVGILVGYIWNSKWLGLRRRKIEISALNSPAQTSPPSGLPFSPIKGFGSAPSSISLKMQPSSSGTGVCLAAQVFDKIPIIEKSNCSIQEIVEEKSLAVTEEDLEILYKLVEVKDGGPSWIPMMECSTSSMSYEAWQRHPENGPPQYRSRTVYENVTSELVRDFFWDDEFRLKWDDMLLHSKTIEECSTTGTMVVHWIRKFPLFCSDRDYTIGRRIWVAGDSYYCVTKGVPCPSVPRSNKPRRVDLYYSSWCIRPVESTRANAQNKACEVILFHHEDMGIPYEITKFGVRQGMWGTVKKIEASLRSYQTERENNSVISPQASMAQINTKVAPKYLTTSIESSENASEIEKTVELNNLQGRNIPKLIIIGGAFILACSLDRGFLTNAAIFGAARKLADLGRRLPFN